MERRIVGHPARDVRDYDHNLTTWFNLDQLELMYERNPRWAALEERLYGDLLLDPSSDAARAGALAALPT